MKWQWALNEQSEDGTEPASIDTQFIKTLATQWRDERRAFLQQQRATMADELKGIGGVYGEATTHDTLLAELDKTTERFTRALEQAVFGRPVNKDELWTDKLTFSGSVHDFRVRAEGLRAQALQGGFGLVEELDLDAYKSLTALVAEKIGPKITQYKEMQAKRCVA